LQCSACNEANDDSAAYCEACGTPLNEAAKHTVSDSSGTSGEAKAVDPLLECPGCHAGPGCIDEDGHCTSCGTKRKAAPRDHFFQALSANVAGVCDIGMKYRENQDYMGLAEKGGILSLVVCDGVSNSQNPMKGSKAASELARDMLLAGAVAARSDLDVLYNEVVVACQEAICKVPFDKDVVDKDGAMVSPAQATFVAALVQGRRVTIGWVGDSRAYWISDTQSEKACQQLTVDHSWLNWAVSEGGMTLAEAEKDKRAHAIIRSLGAAEDGTNPGIDPPDIRTMNISGKGTLVVCSDGLWNYLKDEEHLRSLVSKFSQAGKVDALTVARKLVTFAREAGGHDNITAVVAYLQ
jgi:serine/threonine protein phosphatase PrpC